MGSEAEDDVNYEHLFENGDDFKHEKLVENVLKLNKTQQLKKPSRTEPTTQISEFNLVKSIAGLKGSVKLNDLAKVFKHKKTHAKLGDKLNRVRKNAQTLPKPLEKPQANKIRRTVAFKTTKKQLNRWEPVVTSNRVSTNLNFPLDNDVKLDKKEAENFTGMWRVKSKLEEELEKVDPPVVEVYDIEFENSNKFPMNMKEMLARRREAAKLRAFQGYQEAKARRQNKIKSKKYHRIQKREKMKEKLKEFEQLQKTNPELALQKLDEIEKTRAEERFSLRHKSTGKWARSKQIRAKYDKESRQVLAEQLRLSRDLTQKHQTSNSDSEEEAPAGEATNVDNSDPNNPWLNGVKPGQEVSDFISDYRKYWLDQNKQVGAETAIEEEKHSTIEEEAIKEENEQALKEEKQAINELVSTVNIKDKISKTKKLIKKKNAKIKKSKKKIVIDKNDSTATSDWDVSLVAANQSESVIENMFDKLDTSINNKIVNKAKKLKKKLQMKEKQTKNTKKVEKKKVDLSLPLQSKKPILDDELLQTTSSNAETVELAQDLSLNTLKNVAASKSLDSAADSNIDPNKYLNVKTTHLNTAIPDLLTFEENEEVTQRNIIAEAFEDDDIVKDFNKEKQKEIEQSKPKKIDLSLPGWGSWGGHNIKVNKRKKRRFTIKPPPKMARRDDNKGSLIINENAQSKIKEHMVSEVPFPFKTVKDFEASMRAPIGQTFVPETAFRKLVKPVVTTKMGSIIDPISKDVLLRKKAY